MDGFAIVETVFREEKIEELKKFTEAEVAKSASAKGV